MGNMHPYYPLGADIPAYVPNEQPLLYLLSVFATAIAAILSVTLVTSKTVNPRLVTADLCIVLWFVLCGCIHICFEGYFVLNFRSMGSLQSIPGQLWKEYALSDSRYMTRDTFVVCIETITTTVWGPLCIITASMIVKSRPLRYPLQIILSVAHLYGATLYYTTALFDATFKNTHHSRPEAYYIWGYCVLLNFPWILVPAWLIWRACTAICNEFESSEEMRNSLQGTGVNGNVKKHVE